MYSNYLVSEHDFDYIKYFGSPAIRFHELSCMKRISDDKYLFFSDRKKAFFIGELRDFDLGRHGSSKNWEIIEIPVVINSDSSVDSFIGIINFE